MISIFVAKNGVFENRSASVLKGTRAAEAQKNSFCSPKSEIMPDPLGL